MSTASPLLESVKVVEELACLSLRFEVFGGAPLGIMPETFNFGAPEKPRWKQFALPSRARLTSSILLRPMVKASGKRHWQGN